MANDKWQITNNKWMFKKAMTAKANPPHILFTNNKWQMEIDNKNKGQMTKNKWQNSNGFHRNTNTARAAKFKYVTHPYQLEYQQPGKGLGSRSAKLLWGSSFRHIGSLQLYACFSTCQLHLRRLKFSAQHIWNLKVHGNIKVAKACVETLTKRSENFLGKLPFPHSWGKKSLLFDKTVRQDFY